MYEYATMAPNLSFWIISGHSLSFWPYWPSWPFWPILANFGQYCGNSQNGYFVFHIFTVARSAAGLNATHGSSDGDGGGRGRGRFHFLHSEPSRTFQNIQEAFLNSEPFRT